MMPSGLTYSVINRASLADRYIRVRDSQLASAVAQFLYDEAALLDEWRLDEWLALFHPEAGKYLIPSPEDLSDDPATTLHLVNDSMTALAGRIERLKSKHAHAESPRSRTRRQITNVRVWEGTDDLLSRSVFDVTRVRGGVVDRHVGVYEHQLLLGANDDKPWFIGQRRVFIDHGIESAGGQVSILLRSATSMPSFTSSPWIRGAPQRGLAAAMRVISALISMLTEGRPPVGRPGSMVQYSRKRRRCHRRTVSGVTIRRGRLHPGHSRARAIQNTRSVRRSRGRVTVRL
jgi:p-cumate 2,3-dioxygenase beta subunit